MQNAGTHCRGTKRANYDHGVCKVTYSWNLGGLADILLSPALADLFLSDRMVSMRNDNRPLDDAQINGVM